MWSIPNTGGISRPLCLFGSQCASEWPSVPLGSEVPRGHGSAHGRLVSVGAQARADASPSLSVFVGQADGVQAWSRERVVAPASIP